MSSLNDISGTIGLRGPVPAASTAPAQGGVLDQLRARFAPVFGREFTSELQTVYARGAAGEFDDPTLRLEEQLLLQRMRLAQREATVVESIGANAAPTATGVDPATLPAPAPAAAGSGAPVEASTGAALVTTVSVQDQRALHDLRVRQGEARLSNISASLAQDFPKAAALESASTGRWDPETFVPRTRDEAEAFAQRMVIDATEAAARLDLIATQRDAARFEAAATGSQAAAAAVAKLDADFQRQKTYVDKLARIVDAASSGAVSAAGVSAMQGHSMRDAGDISAAQLAAELRASGADERTIERVVGASELAVEQERTPGGSQRLRTISSDAATWLWTHRASLRAAREAELRRIDEDRRIEDRRRDERRSERRREEQRSVEIAVARRAAHAQASLGAAARRQAEQRASFDRWLAQLDAQR